VQNAFTYVVNLTGLLFAIFYVLTALAAIVYYRRRVFSNARDAVFLGVLPLASAGFLVWMVEKSMSAAPAAQNFSMLGIVVVGLLLMLVARFGLKSWFFQIQRESDPGQVPAAK
jgi:amino acid transporter